MSNLDEVARGDEPEPDEFSLAGQLNMQLARDVGEDSELYRFLQQLSVSHRTEFLAQRQARKHKLFAITCFLFFVVARLWILAVYSNDVVLMAFCAACTLLVVNMWRRGNAENRTRDEAVIANLREIVQHLDLFGSSEALRNNRPQGIESRQLTDQADLEAGGGSAAPVMNAAFSGTFASLGEQTTCSICLCDYEAEDKVVHLPCNHLFHDDCLGEWVKRNVKCPMCQLDLRTVNQDGTVNTQYVERAARVDAALAVVVNGGLVVPTQGGGVV
ncbi:hypothetical protein TeGR_g14425, partial [Tetraparma gracilis]